MNNTRTENDFVKRGDVFAVVCEGCNECFPEAPCEPSDCEIRHSINSIPSADVVPRSEITKVFEEIDDIIDRCAVDNGRMIVNALVELKKKHEGGK